ncbi:hypothetical protein [Agrobacterium pusense]|uniref:hypothetical protein n=1 Tax=Agrobacterium pusense TaxID=648995 RepID=UPI00098EF856|nr:hypothetical protein [Agrobacterium pusense]MBW9058281.1 hypothetical protein [Agrobacterium pusense]OOO17222.1 hypothetical protein BTE56_18440 [Agrobacterium pusense]WKD45559.1 hypothetical protein M8C82_19455 [Agrobacterium pusense]
MKSPFKIKADMPKAFVTLGSGIKLLSHWWSKNCGWVAVLVLGAAILLSYVGWENFRGAVCETGGGCILGWVSAMGGWAAALAALVTLTFLRDQYSEAQKLHYSDHYALACLLVFEATRMRHFLNLLERRITDFETDFSDANIERLREAFDVIKALLENPKISEFLVSVGDNNNSNRFSHALAKIDESRMETSPANVRAIRQKNTNDLLVSHNSVTGVLWASKESCEIFSKTLIEKAGDYISKWEKVHGRAKSADEYLDLPK